MGSGSPLSLASKALTASSSPRLKAPTMDSPKLSSWLPGLSHFKRPKIYTIRCLAKDDKEAFGKLAQVIRERMNGSYNEEKDTYGVTKRKGQFEASADQGRGQKVRFKLEPGLPDGPCDTATFLRSIKQMEKALDEYEKEAEFISSANGWNIHRN
ncbi:hypothetical protein BC941DRAFT_39307 [Chlamydoabsidia padenii]|nr:hypothetical protein BC941DRAFT_39307 [Chlamydoabsidia padenii]